MSVVVVSPGGAYDSVWDSVKPISGNYAINYFQYQRMWVCLHAEFLVQQIRHYLRRQLPLLPVQVAGMCRSAKWELYLYGDLFIKVDSDSVDVLPRGVPPPRFFTHFGNGSHHLLVVPV